MGLHQRALARVLSLSLVLATASLLAERRPVPPPVPPGGNGGGGSGSGNNGGSPPSPLTELPPAQPPLTGTYLRELPAPPSVGSYLEQIPRNNNYRNMERMDRLPGIGDHEYEERLPPTNFNGDRRRRVSTERRSTEGPVCDSFPLGEIKEQPFESAQQNLPESSHPEWFFSSRRSEFIATNALTGKTTKFKLKDYPELALREKDRRVLSADGNILAVSGYRKLYIFNLKTGEVQEHAASDLYLNGVSNDGKHVAMQNRDRGEIFNTETESASWLKSRPDHVEFTTLKGKQVAIFTADGHTVARDLATGKQETLSGIEQPESLRALPNGGYLEVRRDGAVHITGADGKVQNIFADPPQAPMPRKVEEKGLALTADQQKQYDELKATLRAAAKPLIDHIPGAPQIADFLSTWREAEGHLKAIDPRPEAFAELSRQLERLGELRQAPAGGLYGEYSSNLNPGRRLVRQPFGGAPVEEDYLPARTSNIAVSSDGTHVTYEKKGKLVVRDLKTGKEVATPVDGLMGAPRLSPNGKFVIAESQNGSDRIFENTGEGLVDHGEAPAQSHGWVDNDGVFRGVKSDKLVEWKVKSICAPNDRIAELSSNSQATEKKSAAALKSLTDAGLCSLPLTPEKLAPFRPAATTKKITEDQALKLLHLYSRPGGFQADPDLGWLMTLVKSGYAQMHPELTASALQTLLATDASLYDQMLKRYPDLKDMVLPTPPKAALCRSADDTKALVAVAKQHIKRLTDKNSTPGGGLKPTTMEDWTSLLPLSPLLAQLSDSDKEHEIHAIKLSIGEAAHRDERYSDVSSTLLQAMAGEALAPMFGLPTKLISEMHVDRRPNFIYPMVVSTLPTEGIRTEKSPYGFYSGNYERIPLRDDAKKTFVWRAGGKDITTTISAAKTSSAKEFIPDNIKQKELWRPGPSGIPEFTSLFVEHQNSYSDQEEIRDNVMDYYKGEGFKFDAPVPVKDIEKEMADLVRSGKLRMLVKGGHGGGDSLPMFRLYRSGVMHIGHIKHPPDKEYPKGREETVMFFESKRTHGADDTLTLQNETFGKWMAERKPEARGQLVYLNEACWSMDQTRHAIPAVRNKDYCPIASTNSVYGFSGAWEGEDWSAVRTLVHGIRGGKDRDGLMTMLDNVAGYKRMTGNENPDDIRYSGGDQFLIPGEPAYKHIERQIDSPWDVRVPPVTLATASDQPLTPQGYGDRAPVRGSYDDRYYGGINDRGRGYGEREIPSRLPDVIHGESIQTDPLLGGLGGGIERRERRLPAAIQEWLRNRDPNDPIPPQVQEYIDRLRRDAGGSGGGNIAPPPVGHR